MSKLSELIPAGGSAKELSAVASGTLPNGQAVILKSNGQVEVVLQTAISLDIPLGSEVQFGTSGSSSSNQSVAFNPADKGKFLVTYSDNNDGAKGKVAVGTISGSSLTFGTASVFNSGSTAWIDLEFDPRGNGTFVVAYRDTSQSSYGRSIVGTVSGNTITYAGSETIFHSGIVSYVSISFDPNTAGSFVIGFLNLTGTYGSRVAPGTISGSSLTYGTVVTVAGNSEWQQVAFSPQSAGKFVFAYNDNSANKGRVAVCTKSGNSVTEVGSYGEFNGATTKYIALSFDPVIADRLVMAYQDGSAGRCRLATFSGTTFTFGGEAAFNVTTTNVGVAFDPTGAQFVVTYLDGDNSSAGTARVCTVTSSGNTITLGGSEYVYNTGTTNQNKIAFDNTSNEGKFVVTYQDGSSSYVGKGILGQAPATSTNVSDFVGFASEAISSGATGVINPVGGVAASVSNTLLLQSYGSEVAATSANSYYVNTSYDPNNANRFVVVWAQPSSGGKAVVGTVSGTSITYGSIASFSSSNTGAVSNVAFDSKTANKLVITFQDDGNSGYGTAVVGTLSGTSLSFGSKYVFESANISDPAVNFNPNTANQFVVAYAAGSSGYSRVGTVSGTSISFATRVTFNSLTQYISISFDINTANKFIICYRDRGNANYGKVIVGAISGTSLSYGTEVTFYPNSITQMVAAYDPSQANKVVIIYRNDFASDVGVALVGTVSGTTISYGNSVVFNDAGVRAINLAFQKTGSKFIITYADIGNSSYGTSITGTLSGTDVTFGAETVFNSGSVEYTSISFDENNFGKFVVAYRDTSNSNYPTAISGNLSGALTIGSTYYVQGNGTVSTVSASPAVNAGKAISATSLLLKG